jgi:SAM-dependent methyltransferase
MAQLYDAIGLGYEHYRCPDRRIATAVLDALGDAATVLNVGAGAGSYEPADRSVLAVEPSLAMIRQRPAGSAPVVQASATHLPFRDAAFAAALAVLTVHHWADRVRGLAELVRVARHRVVILSWDPATSGFWLGRGLLPGDRGDRSAALSAAGGAPTGVRDHRDPPPPGALRLHRWLPRGLLASAACLSGPWCPQRHLHLRQTPRCGIRS